MITFQLIISLILVCTIYAQRSFPPGFLFGAASSSYQIEGGWNADGKGPNIWDTLTHKENSGVANGDNGDVAANSYQLYEQDVELLRNIGFHFYRFSISWSRVLPTGDISSVNEAGLAYYDRLIDSLLDAGITPMVTMFHWDMPQRLQDIGGMANPLIIQYFEQYAKLLLDRYSNRVYLWTTFNEPVIICENGYGNPDRAPFVRAPGVGNYLCGHHLLIAHARVYRMYKEQYPNPDGSLSLVINCGYNFPATETQADIDAAETAQLFYCGWFLHPIFAGGYPQVMRDNIDRRSEAEGRIRSRLPTFTEEEERLILGSVDSIGLNYYTSSITSATPFENINMEPSFGNDPETTNTQDPLWPLACQSWFRSIPSGLTGVLNWIRLSYDNPLVFVTENGWCDEGELDDIGRIEYLWGHLGAVLDAIDAGCNVGGHTTWSIMDNFEWMDGYDARYGIHHVDFSDDARPRTPKQSAFMLQNIIRDHALPATVPTIPIPTRN